MNEWMNGWNTHWNNDKKEYRTCSGYDIIDNEMAKVCFRRRV
jgi:hypothetical protein